MRVGWIAASLAIGLLAFGLVAWRTDPPTQGPGWDDASARGHSVLADSLSERAPVRVLEDSLALLPSRAGAGDVLLLFPTYREASTAEHEAVQAFVEAGGRLIVAGDSGYTQAWLLDVGPSLPGVDVLLPSGDSSGCVRVEVPLDGSLSPVCLPSPSAFVNVMTTQLAAVSFHNSSEPLLLDQDGNGELNPGDKDPRPYAVAASWPSGRGRVLAIADGDLWRNENVRRHPENLAFARALASTDGTLYLDSTSAAGPFKDQLVRQAHRALSAPGLAAWAAAGLTAAGIFGGGVSAPIARPWMRHAVDPTHEDPSLELAARQMIRDAGSPSQEQDPEDDP